MLGFEMMLEIISTLCSVVAQGTVMPGWSAPSKVQTYVVFLLTALQAFVVG